MRCVFDGASQTWGRDDAPRLHVPLRTGIIEASVEDRTPRRQPRLAYTPVAASGSSAERARHAAVPPKARVVMSRLIRTAKSASDWTGNELRAYRVTVEGRDAASFFGVDELPEPNCPRDFLTCAGRSPNTDEATDELLSSMADALESADLGEAAVDEFAKCLLSASGFKSRATRVVVRRNLQLLIGGEQRSAQLDVCIVHDGAVLLLVQEDKAQGRLPRRGEAQLIAEAIAVRQYNVDSGVVGAEATIVVPAILMAGTYPTFYRIPVTAELNDSVMSLVYPEEGTLVTRCSPDLPRSNTVRVEGMIPLDNRYTILRYYEAFRRRVFVPCSEATLGTQLALPP